jgi:hypothetical protein
LFLKKIFFSQGIVKEGRLCKWSRGVGDECARKACIDYYYKHCGLPSRLKAFAKKVAGNVARGTVLKAAHHVGKVAKVVNKVVNKPIEWAIKGAKAAGKGVKYVATHKNTKAVLKHTGLAQAGVLVNEAAKKAGG